MVVLVKYGVRVDDHVGLSDARHFARSYTELDELLKKPTRAVELKKCEQDASITASMVGVGWWIGILGGEASSSGVLTR